MKKLLLIGAGLLLPHLKSDRRGQGGAFCYADQIGQTIVVGNNCTHDASYILQERFDNRDQPSLGSKQYIIDSLTGAVYVALNNGELFELPDSMKGRILESIRQAKQETDSMGMDNAGLAESSLESEPAPEVYIIGSNEKILSYNYFNEQDVALDIYVSDDVLLAINKEVNSKLGLTLRPNANVIHIRSNDDLWLIALLLSLGGDEGRNFLKDGGWDMHKHCGDNWIRGIQFLRKFAKDYIKEYKQLEMELEESKPGGDIREKKMSECFETHRKKMPGLVRLRIESYRNQGSFTEETDAEMLFAICKTIKKNTSLGAAVKTFFED